MPVWIVVVQWLSRSVLLLLLGLSVWSVATMLRCSRLLGRANGPSRDSDEELKKVSQWIEARHWDPFKEWASKGDSLHAGTARAILQTASTDPSRIDRAVKSYLSLERTRLEQGLTVLATMGSNAPFIGLFGTVLGIIQAFGALAVHQTNASDIMVGISEALIATAIGLFVAIPAVVAFNVVTRRLRTLIVKSEALKDLYISRIQER
jgi:biopolymer transport protein ExbB/TolQ